MDSLISHYMYNMGNIKVENGKLDEHHNKLIVLVGLGRSGCSSGETLTVRRGGNLKVKEAE